MKTYTFIEQASPAASLFLADHQPVRWEITPQSPICALDRDMVLYGQAYIEDEAGRQVSLASLQASHPQLFKLSPVNA